MKRKLRQQNSLRTPRSRKRRDPKRGLPPGTLLARTSAEEQPAATRLVVIDYTRGRVIEQELERVEQLRDYMNPETVTWVQVIGLHDTALMTELGELLGIHLLVLEDIVSGHQRPKVEEFEDDLFIVLKAFQLGEDRVHVEEEQISLLLREGMLVTFRDRDDAHFAPIRARIDKEGSRFQAYGSDYLSYAIFDLIVDDYFRLCDEIDEQLEQLEFEMSDEVGTGVMATVQLLKRELIAVKRQLSPTREVSSYLLRSDSPLISDAVRVFLRDLHDHVLRVYEGVDSSREMASSLMEMYMSFVSNRMNEVMKLLTLFSTIFIPLTFLAGIYGMNFDHMPELHWRWAYPTLWGLFLATPLMLIFYFRRRGWLGSR